MAPKVGRYLSYIKNASPCTASNVGSENVLALLGLDRAGSPLDALTEAVKEALIDATLTLVDSAIMDMGQQYMYSAVRSAAGKVVAEFRTQELFKT